MTQSLAEDASRAPWHATDTEEALERLAIMIALRAPEGDFRDWDAIDMWLEKSPRH